MLIAVDDSDASYHAVTYVGRIIVGREDFRVCLLHALPPLPRELLEFGGSSDPQQEEHEEARINAEQSRWVEAVGHAAEPVFTRAKGILHEAHIPADAVEGVCSGYVYMPCTAYTRSCEAPDHVAYKRQI
jgi:hypothetical protein